VTPSSANAVTTTLTVATDVSTTAQGNPGPLDRRKPRDGAQVFLAVLMLGMSGFVRMRRRGKDWLFILLVGIGLVLTGCGGSGGHGGGGGTSTPTGTSTVTVVATSGNLSQTATFTLTVQ
jgi:hypothetical protein